ncbi:MAG TPA: response regulator [Vicinamibacterales bacterium]|nr:response regulator [Vicinamibacterales bacterium]
MQEQLPDAPVRAFADNVPVLLWVNGPDGCEFVNRACLEFLGVDDQADVRGYDWTRHVHPDDRDRYLQTHRASVAARAPFSAEFRLRRHDDQYVWMRSTAQVIRDEAGEFAGYAGCIVDLREAPPRTAPLPPQRILVVDDNHASAETLAMLLEFDGHETRVAHDGLEAIAAAEEFRPSVALVDLTLPKLGGLDVCRRIRQQPWARGITMVTITGWSRPDDAHEIERAGFDGHLVKPIDPDALVRLLSRLVARQAPPLDSGR